MTTAVAEREIALASVSEPDWMEDAVETFEKTFRIGQEFISEDMRVQMAVRAPRHHNAWGAFTMKLIRNGNIVATGERRNMKTERSHARNTPVYRRVA